MNARFIHLQVGFKLGLMYFLIFFFFFKQNCQGVPQIKNVEIGFPLPSGHKREPRYPDAIMHEILFFVSLNVKMCLFLTF